MPRDQSGWQKVNAPRLSEPGGGGCHSLKVRIPLHAVETGPSRGSIYGRVFRSCRGRDHSARAFPPEPCPHESRGRRVSRGTRTGIRVAACSSARKHASSSKPPAFNFPTWNFALLMMRHPFRNGTVSVVTRRSRRRFARAGVRSVRRDESGRLSSWYSVLNSGSFVREPGYSPRSRNHPARRRAFCGGRRRRRLLSAASARCTARG
jgi:hypothetical protein